MVFELLSIMIVWLAGIKKNNKLLQFTPAAKILANIGKYWGCLQRLRVGLYPDKSGYIGRYVYMIKLYKVTVNS